MPASRIEACPQAGSGAFLHIPEAPGTHGIVLTHGAGANCGSALLVSLAEAFARIGIWILRYNLPFRQQRLFGPPGAGDAAKDRSGLRNASELIRSYAPGRVVLAGHSYGGRQASILSAEETGVCDGLLLLSYPLHPPRKPAELRTGHFEKMSVPTLFVHGTIDPFGSIPELEEALRLIPARTESITIERAGHDLLKGKFDIETKITRPVLQFLFTPEGRPAQ